MAGSVAQVYEHVDTGSGTTSVVAATFTGNGVIACATNDASVASTISCADPTNGAYTALDDILDTTDQQRFATFGKSGSTATGSVNVTFTWTAANVFKAGLVVDCTGVAGALDQHTGAYQHLPTTTANTQLSGTTAALNSVAASGALVVGLGFASGGNAPPAQGTTGGTWSAPVAGQPTFWSFGGGLTIRIEWQRVTATTGVQAVFTSAANIDAITAVAVIDETGGAAPQPPPPRQLRPVWPEPSVPIQAEPELAAISATPPVINSPLPYVRPKLASDWWNPLPAPAQIRIGIAAIIAAGAVASAPPAPARQQVNNWVDPPVPTQVRPWFAPLAPVTVSNTPPTVRPRSVWPDPPAPIRMSPMVAALLAPAPALDAPLPNDIARRRLPSRWPEAEWQTRQPVPKFTQGPFTSKYPISISGRKMFYADGSSFKFKGRTAWGIMGLTPTLRDTFLDDCVARGYNTIEVEIPARAPNMLNRPADSSGNLPWIHTIGGATWTGTLSWSGNSNAPDMTDTNPTYWNGSVVALVQACYNRNLLVVPFITYLGQGGGNTAEGWLDEMNANIAVNGDAAIVTYATFCANLLKSFPNIVWGTAGDTAGGFDPENDTITGINAVSGQASGPNFTSQRAGGQISTDGSGALGLSTTINGAYDWLTFMATCRAAYSFATRTLPSFAVEGPYDEEGPDGTNVNTLATQPVRRFAWCAWLNAIGGIIQGNGYIWPFQLSGTPPPSSQDDYRNHLNTTTTQDLTRLWGIMDNWSNTNDLVPSGLNSMRTLIASGAGTIDTTNYVAAAQTSTGDLLICYSCSGASGTFSVDCRSMARNGTARWYDPSNGTFTSAGTFSNTDAAHSFTTPGTNSASDAEFALFLEAATPNPGYRAPLRTWLPDELPRQRGPLIAAVLATPPTISNPPLRAPQAAPSQWIDPVVPTWQAHSEIAPLLSAPVVAMPPPRAVQMPVFGDPWSPPRRASGIAPSLTFAFSVVATVPAPTSAITLVEDFDMTIGATVPVPTSAIALSEAFLLTVAATVPVPTSAIALAETFILMVTATVPAPTSAIALVEDFDMTIGATVPAPTSVISLTEIAQVPAGQKLQQQWAALFGWEVKAAPAQRRTGIAGVTVLPIAMTIGATVPAPTSTISLNTPVTSFDIAIAATVPAPTAVIALNETLSATIAGTVPVPTAALTLAEIFSATIAGTVPAPTAALALAEIFSATIAGTVPAPTAALALAEMFIVSVSGTVPVPTAALALGRAQALAVAAVVPAPTSVTSMNETLSVHLAVTIPAPSSAMTLNSESANPTLDSVTPETIFTGGMLVTLAGSNFQTPYPIPPSNGVLPDPIPTVQVLFDGIAGDDVQVYSGNQLTVIAPAHDPGTVSVTVQNLDPSGDPVSGEVFTLANAVTYKRADLSVSADFTRLNKRLIRLLKQQVIANVSMATSVDYSDQEGSALKVIAVANVPAVTISLPSTRIRYGEYAEDADRNEENIGINFNRRNTFRTVDVTWQIRIFDDNYIRALNLLALLHQVLKDNVLLGMDRDPADPSKGQVQYEFYPSGEFNFADSPNNSSLFVASGSVTVYGYWFEDIASFPEQAVVEKGVQAETIEVSTGVFRP